MSTLSSALLLGLVCLASADPSAVLQSGEQLLGRNKLREAHAAFQSVADNPKAASSLRAVAELRLGCMVMELEGAPPEAAKTRFAHAVQLNPKAAAPAEWNWNPDCTAMLAAVKGEQKPAPPTSTPAPRFAPRLGNTVDRAQLERERAERVKLQERLEALSAQMDAAKRKSPAGASTDPEARDRLSRLEETIATMQVELKERDDRILAMSLKPDGPPAVQVPFDRRITVPTVVFGALAVGALGTGIGFGVSANSAKQAFDKTNYQAQADRFAKDGTRSAIVADACYGGALALAVTAVLVYVFQGPPAEARP